MRLGGAAALVTGSLTLVYAVALFTWAFADELGYATPVVLIIWPFAVVAALVAAGAYKTLGRRLEVSGASSVSVYIACVALGALLGPALVAVPVLAMGSLPNVGYLGAFALASGFGAIGGALIFVLARYARR